MTILSSTAATARRLTALSALALLFALAQPRAASAQQWTSDGNGNITTTGKVGIGTASPASALEVQGADGPITLSQAGVAGKSTVQAALGTDLHLSANAKYAGGAWGRFDTSLPSWNFFLSPTADYMGIRRAAGGAGAVAWADLFRITSAGNVGIGTTAPGTKLDVNDAITSASSYGVLWALNTNNNVDSNPAVSYPVASFVRGGKFGVTYNSMMQIGISRWLNSGTAAKTQADFMLSDGSTPTPDVTVLSLRSNGNVGIGNTGPAYKLDVAGNVNGSGLCIAGDCRVSWSQVGGGGGSSQWTTVPNSSNIYYSAGNVGIGTPGPLTPLHILTQSSTKANLLLQNASTGDVQLTLAGSSTQYNLGIDKADNKFKISADVNGALGAATRLTVDTSGNVGVGTANPYYKLHVITTAGTSNGIEVGATDNHFLLLHPSMGGGSYNGITQAGDTGIVYSNGAIGTGGFVIAPWASATSGMRMDAGGNLSVNGDISATGNIQAKYQDVAEWVPSSKLLPAGTVVVLDASHNNQVTSSFKAYDTRVAGVVSAQPGIALGERGEGKALVATTGRVRVKVDASRAPIQVGDLLVTSDAEGVAMKSVPIDLGGVQIHRPGTIIGKALEPLEKGTGEILVLLSLQ